MAFIQQIILKTDILVPGTELKRNIVKYGKENFIIERIEFFENREETSKKEAKIVNIKLLEDPLCLNKRPGGDYDWSYENRKKGGIATLKKLWQDPLFRERNKQRAINRYLEGKISPKFSYDWTGKKLSDEHKEKISKKAKERNIIKDKNPMYNKRWIIHPDENIPIKVDISELQNFLNKRISKR